MVEIDNVSPCLITVMPISQREVFPLSSAIGSSDVSTGKDGLPLIQLVYDILALKFAYGTLPKAHKIKVLR